jgi:hypothetical protein
MNPQNTTFTFDVCLTGFTANAKEIIRFQNNISSIFTRVRLLYGATPLEDMINYNVIVRNLTEWTSTNQTSTLDNSSIAQGIGGTMFDTALTINTGTTAGVPVMCNRNVRSDCIQGIDATLPVTAGFNTATPATGYGTLPIGGVAPTGAGTVPNQYKFTGATVNETNTYASVGNAITKNYCTRRYQLNLAFGLFTQGKLIPLKFMASQLAIEWTLANDQECIFVNGPATVNTSVAAPTYTVANFNVIPEILEFDASYDAMFLRGLREGGVPIKFSTWHTFIFSTNQASNVNLAIQERSRSVKALFTVQRRAPVTRYTDSHACIFDSAGGTASVTAGNTLQTYQYRIGGRYFPAAPVQTSVVIGGNVSNGGCEAWVELEKALNIVGDYRLSPSVNTMRWAVSPGNGIAVNAALTTSLNELDYCCSIMNYGENGNPNFYKTQTTEVGIAGSLGSSCYASAICLETSNGLEISGLNAEEQSDISFLCNWSAAQQSSFVIEVYSYFDAMIILRENNVLELIQ